MKKFIIHTTKAAIYENSKDVEKAFIKEFSKPQRIVFTEDLDQDDGFVSGIIQDIITVSKNTTLESAVKKYLEENELEDEYWSVYNIWDAGISILTEEDFG